MKCFEYYLQQKELWTTNSIKAEWEALPDENLPEEEEELSQSFNHEDQANVEGEQTNEIDDDQEELIFKINDFLGDIKMQ